MHRILFEIVTKSCIAHGGLLASFLGKKVSTNLGAIQGAIQVDKRLQIRIV
jgi:hypothetical protein